jgi:hypothetical protein
MPRLLVATALLCIGTAASDLRRLVPSMTMSSNTSTTATLPGQGEPQVMKMSSQMRLSITPVTE